MDCKYKKSCEAIASRVPLSAQDKKRRATFVVRLQNLVRTKGLEPPRLSASDPKSDVATNYTMSAGSLTLGNHRGAQCFSH